LTQKIEELDKDQKDKQLKLGELEKQYLEKAADI